MLSDKLFRLHEHTAGAAAGIKHATLVGFEHGNQQLDNRAGRVELAALLAFCQGEFPQEILEHVTEYVGTAGSCIAQGNVADQIDQTAQAGRIEVLASKHFGQHALERGVFLLDAIHGGIDKLTDVRLLGLGEKE